MSSFRTIERSEARFENGLSFFTVKSRNLRGRGDICVFAPEERPRDLPVVILLHGVYGSAWSWALNGGVHLTAKEMIAKKRLPPMLLAMPSDGLWGDGSGYLPHSGQDFEKWIAEDIPALIRESFPEVTGNSPFFISGLSMGGFGALRIGVKYAPLFRAVSAHSSITSLDQMRLFVEEDLAHYHQPEAAGEDVFLTIKKHQDMLPGLRFDCGREDELIGFNRELHQALQAEEIPHEYEEFDGGHQWAYWEEHVKDSLLFFARSLGAE